MNTQTSIVDILNNPLAVVGSIITIVGTLIAVFRYGRKHVDVIIEKVEAFASNEKVPRQQSSDWATHAINQYFHGSPEDIYYFTYRYFVKITTDKDLKLNVISYKLQNYELQIEKREIEMKEKRSNNIELTRTEQTIGYQMPDVDTSNFELTFHYKTWLIFNHYVIYKKQKTIQVRKL
ncbi:hypothetical protein D3C87_890570 [compost metagenome]